MGTELLDADCTLESMQDNFTNEGGYDHRFRYLKEYHGIMDDPVRKERI